MWQYIKSREFWLTILGLILLVVLVYFTFFYVFLPSYTRHGEAVIVPEITKMELSEAVEALDELGLKMEVTDSLYLSGLPPRAIISRDPGGLSKVKPGRRIYLTVNKVTPPLVKFPDILYVSNYQAKLRLESWNLSINQIIYKPHDYRNLVLKAEIDGREIKKGDSLPVGTRVDLIVGKGKGSQRVGVPDLVGKTYTEAISIIHELGLNIGPLRFMPEETPAGLIIQQHPTYYPDDSVQLGREIDLFISGPEPDELEEGLKAEDIREEESTSPNSKPPSREVPEE